MVISDIIQLGNMIIELTGKKRELDKVYLDNFIMPTWELFKKVHDNFMDRLENYNEMTSNTTITINEIAARVRSDAVIYADLRSELKAAVDNIPTAKLKVSEYYLTVFLNTLRDYFATSNNIITRKPQEDQLLSQLITEYDEAKSALITSIAAIKKHKEEHIKGDGRIYGVATGVNVGTITGLFYISDENDRDDVKRAIYYYKMIFQKRFEAVSESFYAIRKELLI